MGPDRLVTSRKPAFILLSIVMALPMSSLAAPGSERFPENRVSLLWFSEGYCREHNLTCVLDMSFGPSLCAVSQYYFSDESLVAVGAELARQCPDYQLTSKDGIVVVGPRQPERSALSVMVGPINKRSTPDSLLARLLMQSQIHHPAFEIISEAKQVRPKPPRTYEFRLPRDTFMANIVRASKISGPSFWAIIKLGNDSFQSKATDYRY